MELCFRVWKETRNISYISWNNEKLADTEAKNSSKKGGTSMKWSL